MFSSQPPHNWRQHQFQHKHNLILCTLVISTFNALIEDTISTTPTANVFWTEQIKMPYAFYTNPKDFPSFYSGC